MEAGSKGGREGGRKEGKEGGKKEMREEWNYRERYINIGRQAVRDRDAEIVEQRDKNRVR